MVKFDTAAGAKLFLKFKNAASLSTLKMSNLKMLFFLKWKSLTNPQLFLKRRDFVKFSAAGETQLFSRSLHSFYTAPYPAPFIGNLTNLSLLGAHLLPSSLGHSSYGQQGTKLLRSLSTQSSSSSPDPAPGPAPWSSFEAGVEGVGAPHVDERTPVRLWKSNVCSSPWQNAEN